MHNYGTSTRKHSTRKSTHTDCSFMIVLYFVSVTTDICMLSLFDIWVTGFMLFVVT